MKSIKWDRESKNRYIYKFNLSNSSNREKNTQDSEVIQSSKLLEIPDKLYLKKMMMRLHFGDINPLKQFKWIVTTNLPDT